MSECCSNSLFCFGTVIILQTGQIFSRKFLRKFTKNRLFLDLFLRAYLRQKKKTIIIRSHFDVSLQFIEYFRSHQIFKKKKRNTQCVLYALKLQHFKVFRFPPLNTKLVSSLALLTPTKWKFAHNVCDFC